ncbi:MAG: hypothetical protein IPO26_19970 [Saprospiraceae bacterium]|nr:hypothetical protein [Saprospiraceae bacterium]
MIKNKKATALIKDLYTREGCEAGGYGHVVFDDWNIDCVILYRRSQQGAFDFISDYDRDFCIEVLEYFATLTDDEKYTALALSTTSF